MSSVHCLELNGPAAYLCAQAGCRECLNRLVEHHEGLIHRVLRQQYVGRTAYADLLQEGRIAVWHAILRFDVYDHRKEGHLGRFAITEKRAT